MSSLLRACILASAIVASLPLSAADTKLDKRTLANAGTLAAAGAQDTGAYAIVESLTTEIGPRLAGSPAYDRATKAQK